MGWKTDHVDWIQVRAAVPELLHQAEKQQTFCHIDVSFYSEAGTDFHGSSDMHGGDAHGKN